MPLPGTRSGRTGCRVRSCHRPARAGASFARPTHAPLMATYLDGQRAPEVLRRRRVRHRVHAVAGPDRRPAYRPAARAHLSSSCHQIQVRARPVTNPQLDPVTAVTVAVLFAIRFVCESRAVTVNVCRTPRRNVVVNVTGVTGGPLHEPETAVPRLAPAALDVEATGAPGTATIVTGDPDSWVPFIDTVAL